MKRYRRSDVTKDEPVFAHLSKKTGCRVSMKFTFLLSIPTQRRQAHLLPRPGRNR